MVDQVEFNIAWYKACELRVFFNGMAITLAIGAALLLQWIRKIVNKKQRQAGRFYMIRLYQESDVEEIITIWYSASQVAHPFLDKAYYDQEKTKIKQEHLPNTITWVYADRPTIAGFISMIGNEVDAFFVRPEKHGQGIGKALMDHVSEIHQELELEVLKQNTMGRAFYNRYGFKVVREYIQQQTGHKAFRMKYTQ